MLRIAVAVLMLCVPSISLSHEWLSGLHDPASGAWCCNVIDCQAEPVQEVEGGFKVTTGEIIPYSRVLWKSADGRWWRCRNLANGTTRCLIGPPPSM